MGLHSVELILGVLGRSDALERFFAPVAHFLPSTLDWYMHGFKKIFQVRGVYRPWCCHINFGILGEARTLEFSGDGSRYFLGIERFESVVVNCLCGTTAG